MANPTASKTRLNHISLVGITACAALTMVGVSACGTTVKTAARASIAESPVDIAAVEVTGAAPTRAYEIVSLAYYEVPMWESMPEKAPSSAVDAMRAEAAAHGANAVLVERLDTTWRQAFYGKGLRWSEAGSTTPPACGDDAKSTLKEAADAARTCLDGIKKDRPALQGQVKLLLDVDAFGAVLQAAATPDSTRDSAAQQCALEAIFTRSFSEPKGLTCRAALEINDSIAAPR